MQSRTRAELGAGPGTEETLSSHHYYYPPEAEPDTPCLVSGSDPTAQQPPAGRLVETGSPQSPVAVGPAQIPKRVALKAQSGSYSYWLILVALPAHAESGFYPNLWKLP